MEAEGGEANLPFLPAGCSTQPFIGLAAPFVPLARSVLEEEIFFARKKPQKPNNKYLLMRKDM